MTGKNLGKRYGVGGSHKNRIHYNLRDDKCAHHEVVNLPSDDPNVCIKVMTATSNQNKYCKYSDYHFSLNWKNGEIDRTNYELQTRAAKRMVEKMGLAEHQYLIYVHKDTDHPHVHIQANRVHPKTFKAWSAGRNNERIQVYAAEIAKEMGFTIVPGRLNGLKKDKEQTLRPTKAEQEIAQREGRAPLTPLDEAGQKAVRTSLKGVFKESKGWDDLTTQLKAKGYQIEPKGQGHIVTDGKAYIKLSQMGKPNKLTALEERFKQPYKQFKMEQEPEKPKPSLEKLTQFEKQTPAPAQRPKPDEKLAIVAKVASVQQDLSIMRSYEEESRVFGGEVRQLRRHMRKLNFIQEKSAERVEQKAQRLDNAFQEAYADPQKARESWEKSRQDGEPPKGIVCGTLKGFNFFGYQTKRRKAALKAVDKMYELQKTGQFAKLNKAFEYAYVDPRQAKQNWRSKGKQFIVTGNLKGFSFLGFPSPERKKALKALGRIHGHQKSLDLEKNKHVSYEAEKIALQYDVSQGEKTFEVSRDRLGDRKERLEKKKTLFRDRARFLCELDSTDIEKAPMPQDLKRELFKEWERENMKVAERNAKRELEKANAPTLSKKPEPQPAMKQETEKEKKQRLRVEQFKQELKEMEAGRERERTRDIEPDF